MDGVIAYASQALSKSERKYLPHNLGFLVLKWAVTDQFHEYLYGTKFEVYTNNNQLTYALTSAKLDAVGQHWIVGLAYYNFHLHYNNGKSNVEADALSRILWSNCREDCNHLDGQAVKATVVGSTTKAPLFEPYQGRAIMAKSLHTNPMKVLLFPSQGNTHNIEPQKITRDQWIQEKNNNASISEIRKLIKAKKLLQ